MSFHCWWEKKKGSRAAFLRYQAISASWPAIGRRNIPGMAVAIAMEGRRFSLDAGLWPFRGCYSVFQLFISRQVQQYDARGEICGRAHVFLSEVSVLEI